MNSFKIKFLITVALPLLSGCAAYFPQTVDVPLIREKGDLRVTGGYFCAPDLKGNADIGAHGTITYGLANMLAVQGYVSSDVLGRAYVQGALGLFKEFKKNSVVELYGGYGYGEGANWKNTSPVDSSTATYPSRFQMTFAQFNIGRTDLGKLHIDYGLGLKGGYIFSLYSSADLYQPIPQKNGWIMEPSIFFRFGKGYIKFFTQVNYLWTKTIRDDYYYPLNVSMGVSFFLKTKSK